MGCVLSGLWNVDINMQACNLLWDFSAPGHNEEQRFLLYFNVIPGRSDGGSQRSLNLSTWPWRTALHWSGCLGCSEAGWQTWAGRSRAWSRLEVRTVILWPGMMTAAPSPSAAPCSGGCCVMTISLCTRCGQGHLEDALDWDEVGVAPYISIPHGHNWISLLQGTWLIK